jgi:hypothetical protein
MQIYILAYQLIGNKRSKKWIELEEEHKKQAKERRNVRGNIEENRKITRRKMISYLICK